MTLKIKVEKKMKIIKKPMTLKKDHLKISNTIYKEKICTKIVKSTTINDYKKMKLIFQT